MGSEIDPNDDLTQKAKNVVTKTLDTCHSWKQKLLWFTTKRMQQRGIKRIQFEVEIDPRVNDELSQMEAIRWNEIAYPFILKFIGKGLNDSFVMNEEWDALFIRFQK